MITLTTGVPGSGKSLYTISYVKAKSESENRPVFYHGIKDLTLPWLLMDDPREWDSLPEGSIIVIDECQTVFRPRGAGSQVPAYIAALETHRHKGYDIFLITQHPMLVDQNIRRLVGQHFHVVRKFGLDRANVHEWGSTHEITQRNLAQATQHIFRYTQEAYSYYKSAEMHTHKKRIPMRVYFLMAAPLLIGVLVYLTWTKLSSFTNAAPAPASSAIGQLTSAVESVSTAPDEDEKIAYLEKQVPRLAGLPWTAPQYDEITAPKDAPRPVSCIENRTTNKCRCVDQQYNTLHVSDSFCRNFVQHGMFVAWEMPQAPAPQAAPAGKASAPGAMMPPQPVASAPAPTPAEGAI